MSEWVIVVQCQKRIFSAIPTGEQDAFQWDDVDVNFSHLDLFSSNTQTPPSAGWNISPFGHIILTQSLPIFALSASSCVCSRETANTICLVFGLTRPGTELTIYRTRAVHPNHYTTNTVGPILKDYACTFKTPPHVLVLTSYLFVYKGIYIYVDVRACP